MAAGTRKEASDIWALFYLLGIKLLEMMTVDILMGRLLPSSRYAELVLGKASDGTIPGFRDKYMHCLQFALTRFLVNGSEDIPVVDNWNFTAETGQVTSKKSGFCRFYWAEMARLVSGNLFIPASLLK